MKNKKVLVIIPAYNEELNIEKVVDNLIQKYPMYDYVVVNDGSKDNTKSVCERNHYNTINFIVNIGLAGGIQAGMKYAYYNNYDYAIQIDADGQHNPRYIEKMLECAESGTDIVIGSRFVDIKKPFTMRMMGSRLITAAIKMTTGKRIADPTSGMRLFSRHIIEECAKSLNYGPEPDTISFLIKNGASVKEVQVEMREREAGDSYLTPIKSMLYMIRMMISILIIQNFRRRQI